MLKSLIIAGATSLVLVPIASAGPVERLGRLDHRLSVAEARGAWAQNTRADYIEDRFDRYEDIIDRREDRRDRAVTYGPRDLAEDRWDRWENHLDRQENR